MAKGSASRLTNRKKSGGKHRPQRQTPEVVTWLSAGAITLGLGAAMASGTGVASAETSDDSSSSSASSTSSSDSTSGSNSKPETTGPSANSPNEQDTKEGKSTLGSADDDDEKLGGAKIDRFDDDYEPEPRDVTVQPEISPVKRASSTPIKVEIEEPNVQEPIELPGGDGPVVAEVFVLSAAAVRETQGLSPPEAATSSSTVIQRSQPEATATAQVAPLPGYTQAEWDAYIQQFRDADPSGAYITPASATYFDSAIPQVISEAAYREALAAEIAEQGTRGFSVNPAGLLQYTNWRDSEVGIIYGPHPVFDTLGYQLPSGFVRVRPGGTVTLSDPQAKLAMVQVSIYDDPDDRFRELAGLGYAPFGSGVIDPPDPEPQPEVPLLATPIVERPSLQQVISGVIGRIQTVVSKWITDLMRSVYRYLSFDSWVDASNSPTTTQALYERLQNKAQNAPNSVWVDKVVASDGTRFVVYLGGTMPNSTSVTNANFLANFPAYGGAVKEDQVATIANAIIDGGGDINSKVMLVGFSQGGMDAQNIAKKGLFNVTTVVTYGSPVLYNAPTNYRIVFLEAEGDPVPGISRWTFPGIDRKSEVASNSQNIFTKRPSTYDRYQSQWWNLNRGMDMHGDRATYADIARQFDRSGSHSQIKEYIQKYAGLVTQSWDDW